ncbi:tryptophanase leader peptide [Photobacterium sp. DNB23_23_1]
MSVYLKLRSTSVLALLAWYNLDHKLSFHLSSE